MAFPRALAALVLLALPASAQTVYVSASLQTGANDGTSWADAYQGSAGLHAALAAAVPGTEIWITGGTYLPSLVGGQSGVFLLESDQVVVRGGFEGTESSVFERPERGSFPTILSGDLAGNDDGTASSGLDNSRRVLRVEGLDATLENLSLVGGGADPLSSSDAALFAFGGTVTLSHCVIERCLGRAARVFIAGAVFADCTIRDIEASSALLFDTTERVRVSRCNFERCATAVLFRWNWSTDTVVEDSLITKCTSAVTLFSEDLFAVPSAITVDRCTFAANQRGVNHFVPTQVMFPMPSPTIVQNSILWGQAGNNAEGEVAVRHSIVQGGFPGIGVLSTDPDFVDPVMGDYSLSMTSPAIDRAQGIDLDPSALDLARRFRAFDVAGTPNLGQGTSTHVDYGAFEFSGSIGRHDDCMARPNSTGHFGRLFARGSDSAAANDLRLDASDLPPMQFGMFLASRGRGFTPLAGGLGTLCLGGTIGRLNGPGQIQSSGPAGSISLDLDLTRIPAGAVFAAAQAGETWRFQLWHRDFDPGLTTNMTSMVTVTFR